MHNEERSTGVPACGNEDNFKAKIVHCALCIVHSNSARGQAAVEFVVALIALLLIVTGGVFLSQLQTAQRDMTTTLRGQAGDTALGGAIISLGVPYILRWDDGPDERPGTADDEAVYGHAIVFNNLADYAAAEGDADWERLRDLLDAAASDPDTASGRATLALLNLRDNPTPMSSLEFVRRNDSRPVTVERFIRQLVIPSETVTVTHEVYFPSCSNLY